MSKMMQVLKKVDGLFITPVSDGADAQNEILCQELPFKVLEYKSGREHNGWVVPQKWEVIRATIKKEGKLIYDGKKHPLGVIGYSDSFKGKIKFKDLKGHLFYKENAPDNIVYHCDLYYKPFKKLWGFSLPYNIYKKMKDGDYEIDLETQRIDGTMKVLEYTKSGKTMETIILNAHNCHAAQLNDGPAGYAVGIEVLKRLSKKDTKYTYKLVIAPEHMGTVFYLAGLKNNLLKYYKYCIFLEMLGNENPRFALQETFSGDTDLDKAASNYLKFNAKFYQDRFRKIVGNDETVWEAPGIEIPTISLSRCENSRFFYPEYHLDSDNIKIMKEDKLEESVNAVLGIIDTLETNCFLKRKFSGLIALSNPKYNLYLSPGTDPSMKLDNAETRAKWNYLMDCLPRYFNKNISILDIAIKHDLPYKELYNYLLKFKEKKLVEFIEK
ncbi:MAG: DUF4910 domain-containing protein [Patescibacteria group bacterium]